MQDFTDAELAATHTVSAPGMTPSASARRHPYRREPYGRATIPTALGEIVVDGKFLRTEDGSLVEFWRDTATRGVIDVLIPAAWVQPIRRDESAWVDPYDVVEDQRSATIRG